MIGPPEQTEQGATAAEYVLLVTIVAVFVIGAMFVLEGAVSDLLSAPCTRTDALDAYCP